MLNVQGLMNGNDNNPKTSEPTNNAYTLFQNFTGLSFSLD